MAFIEWNAEDAVRNLHFYSIILLSEGNVPLGTVYGKREFDFSGFPCL